MHFSYSCMCNPYMHRGGFPTCTKIDSGVPGHHFVRVFYAGRSSTLSLPVMKGVRCAWCPAGCTFHTCDMPVGLEA